MKPIPATVSAVLEISRTTGEPHLLADLQGVADEVQELVPDCLGLSLAWDEHGVTFTLVASDAETAAFDALQYLDGGPSLQTIRLRHGFEAEHEDLLDEDSWRLFAQGTAAAGVRCTLTFPLTAHGRTVGSANLYGGSDNAFEGHHEDLAQILGGWAPGAVRNADLSFETMHLAEDAPASLRDEGLLARAVGILMVLKNLDDATARGRIREAADRAGIRPTQLAAALIRLQG